MNVLEFCNTAGAASLDWTIDRGVPVLAVLLGVLLLWQIFGRRCSAHIGYGLHWLPLVVLLIPLDRWGPPIFQGSQGVASWTRPVSERIRELGSSKLDSIPIGPEEPGAISPGEVPPRTRTEGVTPTGPEAVAREAVEGVPAISLTPAGLGFAVWFLASSVLLLQFARNQRRLRRCVVEARELEDEEVGLSIEELSAEAGLDRPARLAVSPEIPSPSAWGIRMPTVVLPEGLLEALDAEELRWILLHELAHLRRHDLAAAAVQRMLQILLFFHPLVWIANRRIDELRECACDEEAMARSGGAPTNHGARALLEVITRSHAAGGMRLGFVSLYSDKSLIQRRIMRLIDTRRVARRGLGLGSVPVFALALSATVAVAQATRPRVDRLQVQEATRSQEPTARDLGSTADPRDPALHIARAREAAELGTDWLVAHQTESGAFPVSPGDGPKECGEYTIAGVTGIAIQCLLEAEAKAPSEQRSAALQRGLTWLERNQDEQGCFGPSDSILTVPSHAMATTAWLAAQDFVPAERWEPVAKQALACIYRARNPYGAWRYDLIPTGDADSFITGLMMRVLADARERGLEVDPRAIEGGMGFLDEMLEPKTGRTGYSTKGSLVSRLAGREVDFPLEYTEMLTAIAMEVRLEWDQKSYSIPGFEASVKLLHRTTPLWDTYRGSIDYYHWLHGTEALAELGGDELAHWRGALVHALYPNQVRGTDGGSWPAIDAWSDPGTEGHATAVCTLALWRSIP